MSNEEPRQWYKRRHWQLKKACLTWWVTRLYFHVAVTPSPTANHLFSWAPWTSLIVTGICAPFKLLTIVCPFPFQAGCVWCLSFSINGNALSTPCIALSKALRNAWRVWNLRARKCYFLQPRTGGKVGLVRNGLQREWKLITRPQLSALENWAIIP